MTKLQMAVGCAGVAAAVIFLAVEHGAIQKLHVENDYFQTQLGEVVWLRTENQRLSNLVSQANRSLSGDQLSELLKLRSEVGFLRRQTNELRYIEAENRQLRSEVAAVAAAVTNQPSVSPYLPKESWAFLGYTTPETALQSLCWATSNGDPQTFLDSLTPDRLEQLQESGVPREKLTAALAEETGKIKGYKIMKTTAVAEDHVVLEVSFDGEVREVKLQRIQGLWKLAEPISTVRSTPTGP